MLGHKNVTMTQRYPGVNYVEVRDVVETMVAMESERDILGILSCSELSDGVGNAKKAFCLTRW